MKSPDGIAIQWPLLALALPLSNLLDYNAGVHLERAVVMFLEFVRYTLPIQNGTDGNHIDSSFVVCIRIWLTIS